MPLNLNGVDLSGLPDQAAAPSPPASPLAPEKQEDPFDFLPDKVLPGESIRSETDEDRRTSVILEDFDVPKALNAIELGKMLNIKPSEAYDSHDEFMQKMGWAEGIHGVMPPDVIKNVMLTLPVVGSLARAPIFTATALASFTSFAEAESYVISRWKRYKYQVGQGRGLSFLLPKETGEITKNAVDAFDFIGKALLSGGPASMASKRVDPGYRALVQKFTKDIITEYKLPEWVYIPARSIKSIFQTGEHISPAEMDLLNAVGATAEVYKVGIKNGLEIRMPGEKLVTMVDKPWWGQIKEAIGVRPYQNWKEARLNAKPGAPGTIREEVPAAWRTPEGKMGESAAEEGAQAALPAPGKAGQVHAEGTGKETPAAGPQETPQEGPRWVRVRDKSSGAEAGGGEVRLYQGIGPNSRGPYTSIYTDRAGKDLTEDEVYNRYLEVSRGRGAPTDGYEQWKSANFGEKVPDPEAAKSKEIQIKELESATVTRDNFRDKLRHAFGITHEEALMVQELVDSRSRAWSLKTGKHPEDYYPAVFKDIVKGGEPRISALKQEGIPEIKYEEGGDALGKEYHGHITAKDPKTQKVIGRIDYSYYNGETSVKMIEVDPAYQKKGVGIALLDRLQADSESPITMQGNFATKEGAALWNRYQKFRTKLNQTTSGKLRGSTEFLEDGRAIIRALEKPDIDTVLHELGHVFRSELQQTDPSLLNTIEEEFGAKDGTWSTEAEEKFANAFLRYLRSGKAPTDYLKRAFAMFKAWLTGLYQRIKGTDLDIKIKAHVRRFFDIMLSGNPKAGKATKPGEAKYFLDAVARKGIDPALKKGGELDDVFEIRRQDRSGKWVTRKHKGIPAGIWKKDGYRSFDAIAESLRDDGWPISRENAEDDVIDLLRKDAAAAMSGDDAGRVVRIEKEEADIVSSDNDEFEAWLQEQEELRQIEEGNLQPGDPGDLTDEAAWRVIGDEIRADLNDQTTDHMLKQAKEDALLMDWLKRSIPQARHEEAARLKKHFRELQLRGRMRKEIKVEINKMIGRLKKVEKEADYLPPHQRANVRAILDAFNLSKPRESTVLKLMETKKFIEQNEELVELPDYVIKDLDRLNRTNLRDMTFGEIESVYQAVMHEIHLAKLKNSIRQGRKQRQKELVVAQAISQLRKPAPLMPKGISGIDDKPSGPTKAIATAKKILWEDSLHYDLLIEWIGGKNSVIDDVLYSQVKEGIIVQHKHRQQAFDKFQADLKASGFFDNHHISLSDIGAWLEEPVTVEGITLTRSQRMSLYRHSLNKDNTRAILTGGIGFRSKNNPDRVYQIGLREFKAIVDSLDPAEKDFAGTAVNNLVNANYDTLNRVFLEKNGYDLPRVEHGPYWPKDVMPLSRGDVDVEEMDALDKFKDRYTRIGIKKGMLKKRVGSSKPVFIKGIDVVLNEIVDNSAAYSGLEIPLSNASTLLYDPAFRMELQDRYGRDTWKMIEQGLRDIAGEWKSYTAVEDAIMKGKNMLTSAVFGINPFVMAKQLLALPLYAPYVDASYLARGLMEYIERGKELEQLIASFSPEYRERVEGGYSRDVADVFKSHATRRLTGTEKTLQEKLMGGIRLFDRIGVTPGMWGAVLKALDDFKAKKMSPLVAEALDMTDADLVKVDPDVYLSLAFKFADYATQRTQPMFGPEHRSALSRGGIWMKILTMFTEATNAMFNTISRFAVRYKADPTEDNMKNLMQALFVVFVVNTAGNVSVDVIRDRMYDRPGKNIGLRIADDWSGMFYFVRDLVQSITSKLERGPFMGYNPDVPVSRFVELTTSSATYGLMALNEMGHGREKKAEKYFGKFLDNSLELYLMTRGIPYAGPKKMAEAVIRAAD